jgi:phosphatidylinositol dimannoside acyltransferase
VRWRRRYRRAVFILSRAGARALAGSGGRRTAAAAGLAREVLYWLRPRLTARDLRNLALALPETTPAQRRRILRASLGNSARASLEFLQLLEQVRSADSLVAAVRAEGLAHLDAALAAGRGVIGVSTHLGHFTIGPLWLAARGYPVSVIIREAKHVPAGFYAAALPRLGCEALLADDTRRVAHAVLEALRRGRVVFLYLDQGVKRAGRQVEFLGKHVGMPEGPVVFARRSGAPVVPCFLDPEMQVLRLHEPLDLATAARAGEAADLQVKRLADLAAREIRAHPAHWQWRHRRWARA